MSRDPRLDRPGLTKKEGRRPLGALGGLSPDDLHADWSLGGFGAVLRGTYHGPMPGESLFHALEPLLEKVNKP
ncbi:MAG: hypothetical protein L0H25_05775, partial [Micrococcales bacterium]|nr:hypothetical protein [Micrococcales bacterium]